MTQTRALAGKTAIVTGASSGIGRATVVSLDVRDPKAVQDLVARAVRETKRLDVAASAFPTR